MSNFICDVCNKSFIHSGSLYNHKKWKHSNSKFQCDLCSFSCETKSSLVLHKNNKHIENLSKQNISECPIDRFVCDACGKSFIHSSSFYNHKKWKHSYSKFQCDSCPCFFDRKSSLSRHMKNKHSNISPSNRMIKCTLCSEKYFSKIEVLGHYTKHHNITISNETLEFTSEHDFYLWKYKVEKEEGCEYIRKHCKYVSKVDGTTKITFICHRDGVFKSCSKNKRRLKILGSNKIDGHCPAKITCSFYSSGKIVVIFCNNHVGHQSEIGRMRLSTSDKQCIANKITSQIPFDKILDDIKLTVNTSEIDRLHLLTRKDLLNIKAMIMKHNTGNE